MRNYYCYSSKIFPVLFCFKAVFSFLNLKIKLKWLINLFWKSKCSVVSTVSCICFSVDSCYFPDEDFCTAPLWFCQTIFKKPYIDRGKSSPRHFFFFLVFLSCCIFSVDVRLVLWNTGGFMVDWSRFWGC